MTVNSRLTEGQAGTDVIIEIEKDCISVSLGNTDAGVNICISNGKITAYVYSQETSEPELITLSAR